MAPARRGNKKRLRSADNQHAVHNCPQMARCSSGDWRHRRGHSYRRKHHLTFTYLSTSCNCRRLRFVQCDYCWYMLRHDDYVRLTTPGRLTDATATSTTTAGAVDVRGNCISASLSSVRGEQQRHLMTSLYLAALVDQLALQLSQLRLQTGAQSNTLSSLLNDNIKSSSPAARSDRLASTSINSELPRRTTVNTTSQDNQLCTDELAQTTTSMVTLLRRLCRIPRPVAVASRCSMSLNSKTSYTSQTRSVLVDRASRDIDTADV